MSAIAERLQRAPVQGIDVAVYPIMGREIVRIVGALPAGVVQAPANPAVALLAQALLDKGTLRRDRFALAQQLEGVGASIGFGIGAQMVGIEARCLRDDLPLIIGLLAEQLREPALAEDEFQKARQQLIGGCQRQSDDVNFRAANAFAREIYPPAHPNWSLDPESTIEAAKRATVEEVRAFHASVYGPAHLRLIFAGDFEVARVHSEVAAAFGGWQGGVAAVTSVPQPGVPEKAVKTVFLPDRTSVAVVLGQAIGLKWSDPGHLALEVGTAVLGRGFSGRLMARVRVKEGLTYGIGAGLAADLITAGDWRISAAFTPALVGRGLDATREELGRWHQHGVTADELARYKTNLIGHFEVGLATVSDLAQALLRTFQAGVGADWLDSYPHRVRALEVETVNAAIQTHLNPDRMVLVQAGTIAPSSAAIPAAV